MRSARRLTPATANSRRQHPQAPRAVEVQEVAVGHPSVQDHLREDEHEALLHRRALGEPEPVEGRQRGQEDDAGRHPAGDPASAGGGGGRRHRGVRVVRSPAMPWLRSRRDGADADDAARGGCGPNGPGPPPPPPLPAADAPEAVDQERPRAGGARRRRRARPGPLPRACAPRVLRLLPGGQRHLLPQRRRRRRRRSSAPDEALPSRRHRRGVGAPGPGARRRAAGGGHRPGRAHRLLGRHRHHRARTSPSPPRTRCG